MQGLALSRYHMSANVVLNPALIADPGIPTEIRLGGLSAFAHNDHGHLAAGSYALPDLFTGNVPEGVENPVSGLRNGYGHLRMEGPGFFMVHERSTFGVHTGFRALAQVRDTPMDLSAFLFHDFRHSPLYDQTFSIEGAQLQYMTWGELNFSAAHMVEVTNRHHINFGATLKRLFPYSHLGFEFESLNYQFTSENLFIDDFNGAYAIAPSGVNGRGGWAMDLGLIYRKTKNGAEDYVPYDENRACRTSAYKYQIGVALVDVGSARFRQGASLTTLDNAQVLWPDYYENPITSLQVLDSLVIERVEGDSNPGAQRRSGYAVSMPRALNVHGDYSINNRIFLGAIWQQNLLGPSAFALRRVNILSFIPRYQTVDFEASIPVTLREYEDLQVGFALRYRFLAVGSDDFLGAAMSQDLYSADLYARLFVPIRRKGNCRVGGRRASLKQPCWGH